MEKKLLKELNEIEKKTNDPDALKAINNIREILK